MDVYLPINILLYIHLGKSGLRKCCKHIHTKPVISQLKSDEFQLTIQQILPAATEDPHVPADGQLRRLLLNPSLIQIALRMTPGEERFGVATAIQRVGVRNASASFRCFSRQTGHFDGFDRHQDIVGRVPKTQIRGRQRRRVQVLLLALFPVGTGRSNRFLVWR